MSQDVLDDWIASQLSTRSNRKIAQLIQVAQHQVPAVRADHMRIHHQLGVPTKVTPQIHQAVIELTLHHPNFADLQIVQIISERFAIPIACATIN
jgi:hypothetical protein